MRNVWRLIIGCILLSLFSSVRAQEYFSLTPSQVSIDSLLPVFTYQKQLGAHYADSVWHVSIEYPLFEDMPVADIRRYQEVSGKPLPSWPEITQIIGVARKQGVLEVSFVPLVFRDGFLPFFFSLWAILSISIPSQTRSVYFIIL